MWQSECKGMYPDPHTNKPAVIALLHDADEISFPQLQFIIILWHITVQSLETAAQKENFGNMQCRESTKFEIIEWVGLHKICIYFTYVQEEKKKSETEADSTHIPQLRRLGSGLLLWDWGCWEMMRDCLLGWGWSLWRESLWWWDRVLQYLTEVSAIFKISLHTAS